MLYQRCSNSSIHLPQLSLSLSGITEFSTEETDRLLYTAIEQGLCHWDLCPSHLQEEEALAIRTGEFLKTSHYRGDLLLSTGISLREKPFYRQTGARGIREHVDRLLNLLGTDYLDIFYLSDAQIDTSVEESLEALKREIDRGRILYGALRDFNTSESQKRIDLMKEMGIPALVIRANYSLEQRWVEQTLDHLMEMSELNMIASNPLARSEEQNLKLKEIARQRDQTMDQLSLSWLLHQPFVNSILIPCRSGDFIQEACRAMDNLTFSEEEAELISQTE